MLVSAAVVTWLTANPQGCHIGPPVSAGWRRGRESLTKHIVAAVGSRDLGSFGAADIWAIQNHCQAVGLKPSTINHITHSVLRGMLRDLESVGLVEPSIHDRIRKAKKLRLSRDAKAKSFTVEQRDAALKAFSGHWAYPIVAFLFLTGVRVSEMAGLQWRDVDLRSREISIRRARIASSEITDCKTENSQRVISIGTELVEMLGSMKRSGDPREFVFKGRHGKLPVDVHTFRRCVWQPGLKNAGLPPLVIHGARHTFATILLSSGVPIAQVAAHLGDTMRVVERTYAHVLPRFDIDRATQRPLAPPPATQVVAERPRLMLVKG